MHQFICWLLWVIYAMMGVDASLVGTGNSSCSTHITTATLTYPREIVSVYISVPPNGSVSLTTRTIPGLTTTLTWTEPVLPSATIISEFGTTSIMMAEYLIDTIIECGGNFTSTIPGSTSFSTLASISEQTSSYTTASPSSTMTTVSPSLTTKTWTSTESSGTSTWTTSGTSTMATSHSTNSTSSVTTSSARSTSSFSDTTSASISTSLWTSTLSTVVTSGSSSRTSTYVLTGASVTTVTSSSSTSSATSSTSSGDWAVVSPTAVSATPSFPSDVPINPTSGQTSSTGTQTSSSATAVPTARSTAPIIVPMYHAKLDNTTYYVPLCSDAPQTLWRPDGTNFTLSCNNITFAGGQVIPIIENPPLGECQPSDVNGDVCFTQRYNWTATDEGKITCQVDSGAQLFSRDTPGDLKRNLTMISDALSEVKNVAGQVTNAAEQGLSSVGCAAQVAFEAVAAYYFKMIQQEVGVVAEVWTVIADFFKMVLGLMTAVTTPVAFWIDDTDEQFQNLACYVSDGDTAIWRTLSQHTALHAGLNTLASLANVITVSGLIEEIMKVVFGGLFSEYQQFITAGGSITQGWTQAMRVCTTKWDIGSLEAPGNQEPEDDDEDDWLPRYQIFTTPETSMAELRALEHALGGEGWEIASSNATDWIKGYVVDLNIMQALLPKTMPFISDTYRFVWDGSQAPPNINDEPTGSTKRSTRQGHSRGMNATKTHGHQARAFDPNVWPIPTGEQRLSLDNGHYLKTLSQQKGQDLNSFEDYTYADPQGQGTWIVIIDNGFDLKHEKLQSTNYRKVITFVSPNEFSLPKLEQHDVDAGWVPAEAVIDDTLPGSADIGHGTGVACVAAGLGTGVAPRANLMLVKTTNYYINTKTGEKRQCGQTLPSLQKAFSAIRDAANVQRMDYGKRVINLSLTMAGDSMGGRFLDVFFRGVDFEGTAIVMAAGNQGYNYADNTVPRYQAELSPQKFATDDSPYIVVGGTYHDGSIWEWTTPSGGRPGSPSSDATISVWAQADDVYTCDANGAPNAMSLRDGTSFAAPQVAGLAAYMMSYPWPSEQENPFSFTSKDFTVSGGSVGSRIKAMICNTYAYQRLPASEIAHKALKTLQAFPVPRKFPWALPEKVDVIYNMAFGPQKCKDVEGFPNAKRDGLSCPLAPGSGGGGDDGTSSSSTVSYGSATPTYEPSTWTGFSSATGNVSTPSGVFVTASFTLTETTQLPSTTEYVTVTTHTGSSTRTSFVVYTTTVDSPCCPYPRDACGVASRSMVAPTYCSAITARGFEYLNDIATTTSNTGPRSTGNPY